MMAGATPVFADIDPVSLNIAPAGIEEKITEKTRAILPVVVFGNPAGLEDVCAIAEKHNLAVIEDSCEALGSALNGRKVGTFGAMSTFAFYPNKQITTGEGGMILTDDDRLADTCVSLRNQGRSSGGGWLGHKQLGYNFRLSDINCVLGIVQLSRIDEIKTKRQQVAAWYQELLGGDRRIIVPRQIGGCDVNWFVFVVRLAEEFAGKKRNAILQAMNERGVQTSNYFPPVHLQPFMVEKFGYKAGDFPIAESVSGCTVALPFYNNLSKDEVAEVCSVLKECLNEA